MYIQLPLPFREDKKEQDTEVSRPAPLTYGRVERQASVGVRRSERHDLLLDVFDAYFQARRNKRSTRSQLAFEMDLECNLAELYQDIAERRYEPLPGICFIVDKPVKREIFASRFRDRVVHHLLYNYLMPTFDSTMIFDSYSCRLGKGTAMGIKRLDHHLRSVTDNYKYGAYVMKMDIQGYFMSINKDILFNLVDEVLQKRLAKGRTMYCANGRVIDLDLTYYLLDKVLYRDVVTNVERRGKISDWDNLPPSKSILKNPPGVGLPIGDLTSQLFSNIYLGQLDEYMKRTLKCKHYGRYVDDYFVVHKSKEFLKSLVPRVREFLRDQLKLTLHPNKTQLYHSTQGVPFLGAVVMPHRIYVNNRTAKFFKASLFDHNNALKRDRSGALRQETMERIVPSLNSYLGYLGQYRTYKMRRKLLERTVLGRHFSFDTDLLLCSVDHLSMG